MATGRQTLQNDPRLRPFIIPNARPTGTNLGGGSYGSVEELMINGFVCAGKKIHEILLQMGNYGVENIAQKYVQECQLMSDLRHPHLVQFMGVCFLPDSSLPVLVMERLLMSLDDLLENTPDIPLALKRSILADVCKGLVYLHNHSPPVIHRDLSAKNVLLNSTMVAKISDLGNSRIIDLRPGQLARTLSRIPGTTSYMPPEAFDETSRYGTRLDIFSFGHLALFTITQVFPGALKPHNYPNPNDPDNLIARNEVGRREDYIDQLHQQLGEGHPLVRMIKQCLHNVPSRRPSTEEVLQQLEGMRDQIQDPYHHMTKLEMMVALKQKDLDVQQLSSQLQRSNDGSTRQELEQLQMQMQQLQLVTDGKDRTVDSLRAQLHQKETEMNTVQREFRGLQMQLQRLQLETDGKDRTVDSLRAQLNQKETEMNTVQQQLRRLQSESSAQLAARDRLLASTRADLEAQLREEREKDDEISRLQGELRNLQSQLERAQAKPIRGLTLPLRLRWKRCKDIPYRRSDPHAVVIRRRVYMCGGTGDEATVVMVYDPHSDQWSELPPYQFRLFGMAAINQLVLVGGWDDHSIANRLGVWDEKSHQWTEPYPPMKTGCTFPSVVTYEKWLVVAGGYDGHAVLDRVEILDTTTRQWYSAAPLPQRCTRMKSALVGDTLYLMGGSDGSNPVEKVFTVSLPALIRQATTPSEAASPATTRMLWQTLPPTPLGYSAPLALRGSLLAIGGMDDKGKRSSAIHLYQPSTREWVKVGDLPITRGSCVCTLLPSGEILVLGGRDDYGTTRVNMATRVDMATVQ